MAQTTQDHTPGYTLQEQWRTMPMKEYAETFRDFGRVRGYCHGCGRYGKCWACPPYDFAEEEYLGQFTTISLLATKITPSEGVALTPETAERILNRERQRLDRMLLGMEGGLTNGLTNASQTDPSTHEVSETAARAFFAGTCILCPPEKCTRREGLPCRHPESIRPSLSHPHQRHRPHPIHPLVTGRANETRTLLTNNL